MTKTDDAKIGSEPQVPAPIASNSSAPTAATVFQTTVLGIGPWCVEFADGEIVTCRTEARARLIASAPDLLALEQGQAAVGVPDVLVIARNMAESPDNWPPMRVKQVAEALIKATTKEAIRSESPHRPRKQTR